MIAGDRPRLNRKRGGPTFIDAFSGCGGLSLGLERAGWRGLFAIEKDRFAFETLQANFLDRGARFRYAWPSWLEKMPWSIENLLKKHRSQLKALRGKVDLIAGGPPCQGFSCAGRRRADDPRNAMVEHYLQLVDLVKPRFLILENVRGITLDFKTGSGPRSKNFAEEIVRRLSASYTVQTRVIKASQFGVPQTRPRFILIGVRHDVDKSLATLDALERFRNVVLERYHLKPTTTAKQALSDFETTRNALIECSDSPGFKAIGYRTPRSAFQRAMRDGYDGVPSDTRLANHTPVIRRRFGSIIKMCHKQRRLNVQLSPAMREHFGLNKMATRVLDPKKPAPTITSMPDDLLHYSEPRTLTVRENARLQTFPDWFVFRGKYTSGGDRRGREVPRFTQVANAVPPLFGEMLMACWKGARRARSRVPAE